MIFHNQLFISTLVVKYFGRKRRKVTYRKYFIGILSLQIPYVQYSVQLYITYVMQLTIGFTPTNKLSQDIFKYYNFFS